MDVSSVPAGGVIFVNGKEEGVTPRSMTKEVGSYEVEVKIEGFPDWKRSVQVEKDKSYKLLAEPPELSPPVIALNPLGKIVEGVDITIEATVLDDIAVKSVVLFYRRGGEAGYTQVDMSQSGDLFSAFIPSDLVTIRGIDYYIEAADGIYTATSPVNPRRPHKIRVEPAVGTLSIASNVPSAVLLDGKTIGETPLIIEGVREGPHKLALVNIDYEGWEKYDYRH